MRKLLILLYHLAFVACLKAQTTRPLAPAPLAVPVIRNVSANLVTVPRFGKLELALDLTAAYSNAYDYDEISVQCIFFAPSGRKDTVDGFFMEDFTLLAGGGLAATGTGGFKVRYAPREVGSWTYTVSCTTADGTASYAPQTFQCGPSAAPGFIKTNASNYLSFDDGTQYIPVGENMGWQSSNPVTDYTNWLDKLAANKGNFIRVWMSSWAFALEWKNGSNGFSGLKKYKQTAAFYLDWLVEFCAQKGIYLMLSLNNHGQVSTGVNPEWNDNPYNAGNGGPAGSTWDFFTNTTAKDLHKNRLRYIIARYGYAPTIQSWELFNEVDWTDQFEARKAGVRDWHTEMAAFIKRKDVNKHLVSTSFARDSYDSATWSIPAIDFTQAHYYIDAPNIEQPIAAGAQAYLSKYSKPTLNGEFGLGPEGPILTQNDPAGVHIHNALWGTAFSGALGPGLSWWWDNYIEPNNLYYHFKPLATVLNDVPLVEDRYKKLPVTVTGGGAADATAVPAADFGAPTAAVFILDANGVIMPSPSQLGKFLYGSIYNTQYRNPPVFNVNYPQPGQFKVVTAGSSGTSPKVNVYVDGAMLVNAGATVNATYTVDVPAGAHVIKVDNLGTDWILISNYVFTNVGSPLTTYVLGSADGNKVAGYILNNNYNWKYLQNSGNLVPAAVSGANLILNGLQNGTCDILFYSCATGLATSTTTATVIGGSLSIPLPAVSWDLAFRLAVNTYTFNGSGSWSNPANWSNGGLPPSVLPVGAEIIINPPAGDECVLDIPQRIAPGARFTLKPGRKIRINGNLIIQ